MIKSRKISAILLSILLFSSLILENSELFPLLYVLFKDKLLYCFRILCFLANAEYVSVLIAIEKKESSESNTHSESESNSKCEDKKNEGNYLRILKYILIYYLKYLTST